MFNCIPLKQVCQPLVSVAGTFYVENIIDGFMEQGSFGRISQFIVHFLAGAATGKQAGLFEQPKMMRNGGRTHVDGNGNIKLSKKNKDDTQRIDPAAALVNALSRLPKAPKKRSKYEDADFGEL